MSITLVEFVNSVADRWVGWVIAATLDSAVLLLVVSLIWFAIRRKVAPQVGYGLFLLVPLKLLLPVDVIAPPSIANWTPSNIVTSWFEPALHHPQLGSPITNHPSPNSQTDVIEVVRPTPVTPGTMATADLTSTAMQGTNPPSPEFVTSPEPSVSIPVSTTPYAPLAPRLNAAALVLIVWLTVVFALLWRGIRTQWRFHRRIQRQSAFDSLPLGVDLSTLCRRMGMQQPIRVIESDNLPAPAVWGLFRPTIILPHAIASSLTVQQLQWALLHELAHIRRRDLLVVMFQRLATVLHFFNPAVWIANRVANRLREYACDDLADAVSGGSAVESSDAFVQILRHVTRSQQTLRGGLGMFGWDSRAACYSRVSRLLDADRPIRTKSSPWALCGLLFMAAITLPHLRAGADPAPAVVSSDSPQPARKAATTNQQNSQAEADAALATKVGQFELRVVTPEGKPIPEATVHVHGSNTPTAEQIRRGSFVGKASYGVYVKTDTEGFMVVLLSPTASRLNVSLTIPGYGPYWAGWSSENHAQPIPAHFTAELETAWEVGGVIVDSDDKPVAGVEINPSIEYKKRPGDQSQLSVGGTVKTDAAGRWRYASVPVSMNEVHVAFDHKDFKPYRVTLPRDKFGIEAGREPTGKVALDRGFTVSGKVTDDAGLPIADALVRTQFINDLREAKTGKDGSYRLVGCEPRLTKIVVSAPGRATDKQEVLVDPEMAPVNFRLPPGGKVRIRVLDQTGHPVPKARIFFQKWRGGWYDYFEFGNVNQYADANGVWEWNEAPLDEFLADICPPAGMYLAEQRLIARSEEYVFRTPPALVISGKAIDAKTKKPIPTFSVVPGCRFREAQLLWKDRDRFTVTNGQYSLRHTSPEFAHLVRIEAEGYQAAVSRDIQSNEGNVSLDFELTPGTEVAATVLMPDGRPASKANVALGIAGSQIGILNGEIRRIGTYCAQQDTTEAGQFRFPAQASSYELVIVHPTGFAHYQAKSDTPPTTIKLTAWAKVEGIYRVSQTPLANATVAINVPGFVSDGDQALSIHSRLIATTDDNGRFVFERVYPGSGRIGREVVHMVKDGVIPFGSSSMIPAKFVAGETTRIDLGGTGRAVVGRLQPPEGFSGTAKWLFAIVAAAPPHLKEPPMPDLPEVPAAIAKDPAKTAAWMKTWYQTPAGKAWTAWTKASEAVQQIRDTQPQFEASVNRDGTFRLEDLPPGDYILSLGFDQDAPGSMPDLHFKIPPPDDSKSKQPLDLGILILKK